MAALARIKKLGRLGSADTEAAKSTFEGFWEMTSVVELVESVQQLSGDMAMKYTLRAYDAVQLASALTVAGKRKLVFVCWDSDLLQAAKGEGLATSLPNK